MTGISADQLTEAPGSLPAFPLRRMPWGAVTTRRLGRTLGLYVGVLLASWALAQSTSRGEVQAFALGLIFPGGGFLAWADPSHAHAICAIALSAGAILAFAVAIVIWFATGNVVLPVAVWIGAALAAAVAPLALGHPHLGTWPAAVRWIPPGALALLAGAGLAAVVAHHRGLRTRASRDEQLRRSQRATIERGAPRDELSLRELQQMRLLLDRALQPIDRFDGFEWLDQFQTAAVRYQINFSSYALSMAGHACLPAFTGYLLAAQNNLARKLLDHRIWGYWQHEALWGHLRADADPIPRDNIMLSGFLAAQLGYARSASGLRDFDQPGSIAFAHPSGARYEYSSPSIIAALLRQYQKAPYGLLACEPNWVYPLCNAITATAIRCSDAQHGTDDWSRLEPAFRHHLESEFITSAGRLVPFRSSLTGLAPQIGGALMQAFPCLFLNAVLPDIARRQWQLVRDELTPGRARRALWPIDIGNYRLSRASSYAAAAAAAAEMGDAEIAGSLLEALDHACPLEIADGVAHRRSASLWAHAVELIARFGGTDSLRTLVTTPRRETHGAPFIKAARYPDVLVAKARQQDGALSAVLYPGKDAGFHVLTVGGLLPGQSYVAATDTHHRFAADANCEARLNVAISGRTELRISRSDCGPA